MKRLELINNIIKTLISLSGIFMLIGWVAVPTVWTKPLSYLATIALPYAPNLFQLIKFKFSSSLVLAYEVFLIVAMVLGIDLNWYSEVLVFANNSYYDKIVHFFSGILAAAFARELFQLHAHQNRHPKFSLWFQILFLLGIVAIIAVAWECFEFLYDTIFDGHMQELVKSGVSDTMWDMIASLVGGSICIVCLMLSPKPLPTKKTA